METDQLIAGHYTHGALEAAILRALAAAGKDTDHLVPDDLAPVDEFHIGGRQATGDFMAQLDFRSGQHLLDIGCGIGGPSRYAAQTFGCRVTGIDLTPEYVEVAGALSRRVGLGHALAYETASATALPFAPATFDGAYMLHVGMNIADKAALCANLREVVKPGSMFGIYDIMREESGDLTFPVPWATTDASSFVASAAEYRHHLEAAGFEVLKERSRRESALASLAELRAKAGPGGPAPLGTHILMGENFSQKVANLTGNLERGLVAPTEIICRAV